VRDRRERGIESDSKFMVMERDISQQRRSFAKNHGGGDLRLAKGNILGMGGKKGGFISKKNRSSMYLKEVTKASRDWDWSRCLIPSNVHAG